MSCRPSELSTIMKFDHWLFYRIEPPPFLMTLGVGPVPTNFYAYAF